MHILLGDTSEKDLAEKLKGYRKQQGWSRENEAVFMDNLCNGMYSYLTRIDGVAPDLAKNRITKFMRDVQEIMRAA